MRSGVAGAYERAVLPFEDPRWLALWAMMPIEDRRRQKNTKMSLRKSYPSVFRDLVWGMPRGREGGGEREREREKNPILPKLIDRGLRVFSRSITAQIYERGDPRTNPSFEKTLRELIQTFDQRALVPGHIFESDLNMYLLRPTDTNWKRILSSASAETHLASGYGLSGSGHVACSCMAS